MNSDDDDDDGLGRVRVCQVDSLSIRLLTIYTILGPRGCCSGPRRNRGRAGKERMDGAKRRFAFSNSSFERFLDQTRERDRNYKV